MGAMDAIPSSVGIISEGQRGMPDAASVLRHVRGPKQANSERLERRRAFGAHYTLRLARAARWAGRRGGCGPQRR